MALVTSAQAGETWKISVWTPQLDGGFSRLTIVFLPLLKPVSNSVPGMIDVRHEKITGGMGG